MKTPGRILFIALAQSTHTHAWVNLLKGQNFKVRVIGINSTKAPKDFRFHTDSFSPRELAEMREKELKSRQKSVLAKIKSTVFKEAEPPFKTEQELEDEWLANIIRIWKPDIIHTLGFDPAGYEYLRVRNALGLSDVGVWVATVRGGPEMALNYLLEGELPKIVKLLRSCNQLIADNQQNYDIAVKLGLDSTKIAPLGVMPGTGGVDIEKLSKLRKTKASQSRIILWPKAYESPASKALPVFEALKIAWEKIKPCKIFMTAMVPETQLWFQTLPSEIKNSCTLFERIPRNELFELMGQSRIVLAPSLIDGVPNTLYEAMAAKALPILSPIATIQSIISEKNALFARNLYPEEIAAALVRGMSDNNLVDRITKENFLLVNKIANRKILAQKVGRYYNELLRAKDKLNSED